MAPNGRAIALKLVYVGFLICLLRRLGSIDPRLTFTTFCVMERNDSTTHSAGEPFFLHFHKRRQPIFFDVQAVFDKACGITGVVALFKRFDLFARIFGTLKTVRNFFFFHTGLNFAVSAVFWLALIAPQATVTGLFMSTMLITNHAVHSAWRK